MSYCKYCKQSIRLGGPKHHCKESDSISHEMIAEIRQIILEESHKFVTDVARLGVSITTDEAIDLGHRIAGYVKAGMTQRELMKIIEEELALVAMTMRSSLDYFIAELKAGKLQHCVHDEWFDCNLENVTLGYLLRARNFRIVDKNTPADNI